MLAMATGYRSVYLAENVIIVAWGSKPNDDLLERPKSAEHLTSQSRARAPETGAFMVATCRQYGRYGSTDFAAIPPPGHGYQPAPELSDILLIQEAAAVMKKYGKFAVLIAIVIGALIWLASTGVSETKTYYKTIAEVGQMGDRAYSERLRVAGDVENGSIQHSNGRVQFTLVQDKLQLKVAYAGSDPLPDTFRDGAQALADGRMGRDGVFHANKIQAKCASKYEAKPGQLRGVPVPVNKTS
jgi:cytochrome c-type biogenesis protein CcmE